MKIDPQKESVIAKLMLTDGTEPIKSLLIT